MLLQATSTFGTAEASTLVGSHFVLYPLVWRPPSKLGLHGTSALLWGTLLAVWRPVQSTADPRDGRG